MRLWAEHLGVEEGSLTHALEAMKYWLKPTPAAAIRRYDPYAGNDTDQIIVDDDAADPPGTDKICSTSYRSLDDAKSR